VTPFPLLRDLVVVFAGSLLVVLLFHRLRLPSLPGFIVAGMLVGPNALGLVADVHRAEAFAEVGVVLLLFTIGIEFSLSRLRAQARQVVGTGLLQITFTTAATAVAALAFGAPWQRALFLGLVLAQSSTALVLKYLTDRGEIDTPVGQLSTGMLIFQDLSIVPIMLVLPFLAGTASGGAADVLGALGKAVLVVAAVVVGARTVVPRLINETLKTRSRELFLIAVILLGAVTAWMSAAAGGSLALGAFLAGLVISESDYAHQALAELLPLRDVLISLFFVSIGMLVDVHDILAHPTLAAGGVAVVVAGKSLAAAAGPALIGYSTRVSALSGLAVSQVGEFAFVLAASGRVLGLLPDAIFQPVMTVAVLTILVSPFLLLLGPRVMDRVERVLPAAVRAQQGPAEPAPDADISNHVIVVGYGINGRNLSTALRAAGVAHLIVDLNAHAVRAARAAGEPILYGDATREEILRLLGATRARMLVVAISDAAATRRIVRVARHLNSSLYIIARTRYVVEIPELGRLGANVVIPEEFETSVEIFNRVLAHYGVPRTDAERLTDEIRASHYQALRPGRAVRLTLAAALDGVPQMTVERVRLGSHSQAVGQTLADTLLRTRTGALVLSVSRGMEDLPTPDPLLRLRAGDVLTVLGQPQQVAAAISLLQTSGARDDRGSSAADGESID
jgi:CPA2 family monovalent cation:H+ antiporter-2